MNIAELPAFSVFSKASDLHLSTGLLPLLHVDGEIGRLDLPPLTHQEVRRYVSGMRFFVYRRRHWNNWPVLYYSASSH